MIIEFTRDELIHLRSVLKHEILQAKEEVRTFQVNYIITEHLYKCIDTYELLDKKIYSVMRKN